MATDMDRMERMCEEVHTYAGTAERTGVITQLRGLKARNRTCTSLTDLVRRYKLFGDGLFYLPVGHWPEGETEIPLDNVKWVGITRTLDAEDRAGIGGRRFPSAASTRR